MDRLFPPEKKNQPLRRFLSYPEADAMRPGNRFERNRYKFVIFTGCSTVQHPCVLVGCSGWLNPYSPQYGLLWYLIFIELGSSTPSRNSMDRLRSITAHSCLHIMQTPPVQWAAQICQTWIKLMFLQKPCGSTTFRGPFFFRCWQLEDPETSWWNNKFYSKNFVYLGGNKTSIWYL